MGAQPSIDKGRYSLSKTNPLSSVPQTVLQKKAYPNDIDKTTIMTSKIIPGHVFCVPSSPKNPGAFVRSVHPFHHVIEPYRPARN